MRSRCSGVAYDPRTDVPKSPMTVSSSDPLAGAREAFRENDWAAALDLFRKVRPEALAPGDLESMADAAWWSARPDEAIDLLQRAYAAYLAAGNPARAGYVALSLAREYSVKFASAVSSSWLHRARQLLESEPESAEVGYLYLRESVEELNADQPDSSIAAARAAVEVGVRVGDRNLQAIGTVYQGVAMVDRGDVAEGLKLIDDAALAAVSGELGLYATGTVYCNTIAACCEVADFGRAREWADAAQKWSASHPQQPLVPGDCRVHQAEVLALRGAWAEAEESARRGAEELRAFNRLYHVGEALYQIGVIRLQMGDLAGARDHFSQASELNRDPQPGLALLLLEERKVDAALAAIRRALEDQSTSRLGRSRLLPAFIEIAIATQDEAAASQALDELESIAAIYQGPSLRAATDAASGAVLLARGDAGGAARTLRRAVNAWQQVDAPYEGARARSALAQAIAQQGDIEAARMELRAARAAFEKLGAVAGTRRVDEQLATLVGTDDAPVTTARTFLFTDIVNSTNLIEAIGDDAWVDVSRWHDETLRKLFATHGGEELDHAGDGFFVAFASPDDALACAVAIQRALAEHRRTHGFAPQVRSGLHATTAARTDRTFRGKGVHEAARIAALAGGGQILASRTTVDALARPVRFTDQREVTLKGIARPVAIVTIDWHAPGL
jgi:class 3 adenylate cyclase